MDFNHWSWTERAKEVEEDYGAFVNWDEEYYICPECGEPVYADDFGAMEFDLAICPICGFPDYEDVED